MEFDNSWDEDAEFPMAEWRAEVANGDTRLGYADWVAHKREENTGGGAL